MSSLFHKPNYNACLRHSTQSIRGDLVPLRSVAAAKSRHWHLQRALPSPLSLPWPEGCCANNLVQNISGGRSAEGQQTAVIKESLRIGPGVAAPLLRVVPASGATISGAYIPPNARYQPSYTVSADSPYTDHCWDERVFRPLLRKDFQEPEEL